MSTRTLGSRSSFWAPNLARALTAASRENRLVSYTYTHTHIPYTHTHTHVKKTLS